ncbi:23S rRNA pseudouridine2457 synthase [Flavobacterium xinjiangense]|uniref:Pseudouridine synthase n=2 Tax=Flavobacterium xinjiangense TaxID=178356 RepID=A0A1M7PDA9_9FLAO|nr:23S rRNA pseudouridine2457 synthase [Flavobacterium xinjiangense]
MCQCSILYPAKTKLSLPSLKQNIMTHSHFIIYKPYGYLSQFIYELKRKKKLLGELHDFPKGTMAIGRLDEDSEGLLLLTTDGMMSEIIRSKKVDKEYYVQVDGIIHQEAIEQLEKGVEIGFNGTKYITKPCKASLIREIPAFGTRGKKIRDERHGPTSWASITVNEGKFRQVRKMTAAVGFPTLRLVRVRIGNVHLNDLQAGEVKEVENFQIEI